MVAVFSDNTTALAYLKKQGGTRSSTLNAVAQTVLRLCEDSHIQLLPQFIPGRLNVLADSLSCKSQVIGSERTLCFEVFCQLLRQWPAAVDLFSTALNHRLPVYFSPAVDPQSAGTDAMLQSWDGLQAYTFLPSASSREYWRRFGSLVGWSSPWWLSFGLSTRGSRAFWSFWWRFPSSCHERGICSNSPTSIITTRTSPCFS